jgi:signal transduction histidine kinase/CheY-like chemotaxis protein
VLVRLAKSEAAASGELEAALRELAEAAAETLQVERASIWLFDEARTRIDCVELYEKGPHRHSRGAVLAAADFPSYFRGLEEERAIVAHDAHRDPTTREFSASYLTPLGIGAMLDAPVRVRGRMAGVVCHEHVGGPREWSPEEQGFAASIADLAAFALEAVESAAERRRVEQELRQAKETAEAANRAKDHFLATLSHELRTPLTPVLALVSSLQEDEDLPDRVRHALAVIRRNVELEARLIDDLLDLTRISRGKLELRREVVDVRQLLAHAIEVCCGAELASGRIHLALDLGAREHRVWADAPRLTQVLWNLLNNAVKFTPPQAGEIGETGETGEIRVRSWEEDDGGILAVEVADNGIGIDSELLPRIFNAFEQTDRRITRRFGGLGLGLSLSRAIVAMHGGTLEAASAGTDQGSQFTLRLPAGDVPASAPEPTLDRPAASPSSASSLRLLLVEDHADTADAMADLLRALGHEVTVARSVGSALGAAEAQGGSFDLVVSDVGLPDGSGLDLMRQLSSRYGLKGIALSGYGMEEDVLRSREAGFSRHLTKPVDMQALKAAILASAGE